MASGQVKLRPLRVIVSSLELASRPIAPGLIQGAFRGLLAGIFVTTCVVSLLVPLEGNGQDFLAIFFGFPIVAAFVGAADGLEARLPARAPGRLARLLAPPFGFMTATMIVQKVLEHVEGRAHFFLPDDAMWNPIATAGSASLFLSFGLLVAGPYRPETSWYSRARWTLVALSAVASLMRVFSVSVFAHSVALSLSQALAFISVATFIVGAAFYLGHEIAHPIGRRLGRWLEP